MALRCSSIRWNSRSDMNPSGGRGGLVDDMPLLEVRRLSQISPVNLTGERETRLDGKGGATFFLQSARRSVWFAAVGGGRSRDVGASMLGHVFCHPVNGSGVLDFEPNVCLGVRNHARPIDCIPLPPRPRVSA